MILVDTSVLIDYLRGTENRKSALLDRIVENDMLFGISSYTYQEVLQGARDESEWQQLKTVLSTQKIYTLPPDRETHEAAARFFFDLRRHGVTVRSTIDVLIAMTAIRHGLFLLHNDRDFDSMAGIQRQLKVLNDL